jgi:hypothetical protein
VIDDENGGPPGLPQLFKVDYLGEKKILALDHAVPDAFDSPGTAVECLRCLTVAPAAILVSQLHRLLSNRDWYRLA